MFHKIVSLFMRFASVFTLAPLLLAAQAHALQNSRYSLQVERDGSVEIISHGHSAHFLPRFSVVISDHDPHLAEALDKETAFIVPSWQLAHADGVTKDFFKAGDVVSVNAIRAYADGNKVTWTFAPNPRFELHADLVLDAGREDPVIHLHFKALTPGWYSVGYTGAPAVEPSDATWLWQPLVWQERRFPSESFLSTEHMCPLPATFVQSKGSTVGLVVDPSMVQYRLPTRENSRFGVLLRNQEGLAQPMAFAPVFGLPASHLQHGGSVELTLRAFVMGGPWYASYEHIARDIFGFHDYRHNGPASLNTTLDNMVAFAMNDAYDGWNADLKAFDYATDVPGTVKIVSSLHPLSVAILRDDPEIYRRRALPMIEYMMSRQKYLYSENSNIKGQDPSHLMKGPAAEVSELSALYLMSQDRSSVFRYYADLESKTPRRLNLNMVSSGDSFQDLLALYRMSGDAADLEKAKAKADAYIDARIDKAQTDFSDVHVAQGGQFWTDFAPKWVDLLELYETTHDKRYLDAAAAGAREYTEYVWLQPTVPNRDFLVNKDGKTIAYYTLDIVDPKPIPSPEQMVPAWRVSQIGLTPEASTTYNGNPAVLLTQWAAYMLRLSYYTGDNFFRDIARSAVVGRYENFPGYDINGEYTTTYQRPDYPLRPWNQLTYNNIYYNHVWPHIALLYDYLISDAFSRSEGKVNFPSRYAQSYAYLQSKVYGDRPGEVYGESGVRLWMPGKMLQANQTEVNYVSGYGNDALYLILTNQSHKPLQVRLKFDPNVVPLDMSHTYKVRTWIGNRPGPATEMVSGQLSVPITDKGITVVAIDGLRIEPHFQEEYFDKAIQPLSGLSYSTVASDFGPVHGMILSMGKSLSNAYVWLEATDKQLTSSRLSYKQDGHWKSVVDPHYPYEFSLPLGDRSDGFDFYVEGTKADGTVLRSNEVHLHR